MPALQALAICALAQTAIQPPTEVISAQNGAEIANRYHAHWNSPPKRTPADHSVDGPLMGNGDLKVALGGPPEEQRFYLAKNDLWRLQSGYGNSSPVGFGHFSVRIPALEGASYSVTQRWADPHTVGSFEKDGTTVHMRSVVAATSNMMFIELEVEGEAVEVETTLQLANGRGSKSETGTTDDIFWGSREFLTDVDIPTGASVAWSIRGEQSSPATIQLPATTTASHHVNIGREQHGGGRWGFCGIIDELNWFDQALAVSEIGKLAQSVSRAKPHFHLTMNKPAQGATAVASVDGKVSRAWQFDGKKQSYYDIGKLQVPISPTTISCWINIAEASPEANYILSCGEWNQGISLGLSGGKLRFAVNGKFIESDVLVTNKWTHIAGRWDGSELSVFVNGDQVKSSGAPAAQISRKFHLRPGHPVFLVISMASLMNGNDHQKRAAQNVAQLDQNSHLELMAAHADWWQNYWTKSWIDIGESEIEKSYYRSLYHMGACSRNSDFPPGIFGWVTTDKPHWHGDYHLNYNHMAPFYALYGANRVQQADPQDAPLLAFQERGAWYAEHITKTRGVLFPVGIGPLGIETTLNATNYANGPNAEQGGLFFQQRSNSAYSLVNIAQRWRTTYDLAYGKKVYPLVRSVAEFWEDYLQFEKGRYFITGDAIHEGSGQDKNPILSLGLIRNSLDLAIDLSSELSVDRANRSKWEHIMSHLSSWSTQQKDGLEVFRYTEKGTPWWGGNTLGIQHIYPGNSLGLASDPKWIQVAHNTIKVMGRWHDSNGSNSFFPAAVRVGYDPDIILKELTTYAKNVYPNGFEIGNPHGIENFSTTPNTLQEMLCMSHVPVGTGDKRVTSLIRVFPVWPRNQGAIFSDLRAWGAFLVSSKLENGTVTFVKILSERGRNCSVLNPWPGQEVEVVGRDKTQVLTGQILNFPTLVDETIWLRPRRQD